MSPLPARPRLGRVWARVVAVVATLALLSVGGSAASEPDATFPNMPAFGFGYVGYHSSTLAYAQPTRQWIRVPKVVLAVSTYTLFSQAGGVNSGCVRRLGLEMCTPGPGASGRLITDALTFPVAALPSEPRDARFDAFPDVTLRAVAFGSVPVEATLALTLPVDSDGLPIGLAAATVIDQFAAGTGNPPPEVTNPTRAWERNRDTTTTGRVWVRLKGLRVDGVPVDVGAGCRTSRPAMLDLLGKGFVRNQGDPLPSGGFSVGEGGTLKGTIDVPRFANCGTGGEDLSPLVSATASGEDFPMEVQTGQVRAQCWNRPTSDIDWSECSDAPDLPIPTAAP